MAQTYGGHCAPFVMTRAEASLKTAGDLGSPLNRGYGFSTRVRTSRYEPADPNDMPLHDLRRGD